MRTAILQFWAGLIFMKLWISIIWALPGGKTAVPFWRQSFNRAK